MFPSGIARISVRIRIFIKRNFYIALVFAYVYFIPD